MCGKIKVKSFVGEIVNEIRNAVELDDGEKDELVKIVEEAWLSEVCPSCPKWLCKTCPGCP
jgi:hypothetical protein